MLTYLLPLTFLMLPFSGSPPTTVVEEPPSFEWLDHSAVIVDGGQSTIDQGHVVSFVSADTGWESCDPDSDCTVWLAGHRTTRGAIFSNLNDLEIGDQVRIVYSDHIHHYEIVDKKYNVSRWVDYEDGIYGDLVIQTSWTDGALLIYADEILVSAPGE